jgi:tetratricopeptide (TPR) repeat protein
MFYKTIIQGRLSFNNEKSYEKVHKMYEYRTETYYKSDVLLNQEDLFNSETLTLTVPRFVGNASDKSFRNTVSLLEYCSQFAVAGEINAWMIDEGKVLSYKNIQPDSDKAIVMQFRKGDELFRENGKEAEAKEAFTLTLEKYNGHAQAYERRGWTNLRLKNYSDALYDFNKALKLDDSIAFAYYGKAFIAKNEGNTEEAIEFFELTLKKSVALESLYWKARLKKAECHIELEDWEKAAFDLKFFTARKFKPGDSNLKKLAYAYTLYAMVLSETKEPKEALKVITQAFEAAADDAKSFTLAEAYYIQGKIKKELGKRDHKADLKKAIELGSKKAELLLK